MLMEIFTRILAAIILMILSPLFLLISFFSFIFQGYPILFYQERIGFNLLVFRFYKFRTMINNHNGDQITNSQDSRITKWGKVLRIFKLDELPQLWNIVKGDIKFVGSRPEVPKIVRAYPEYFSFLTIAKPGLTDISSIIFKNEVDIISSDDPQNFYVVNLLPVKSELALLFIKKDSFYFRFSIVTLTILSLISHYLALRLIHFLIPFDHLKLRSSINDLLKVEIF